MSASQSQDLLEQGTAAKAALKPGAAAAFCRRIIQLNRRPVGQQSYQTDKPDVEVALMGEVCACDQKKFSLYGYSNKEEQITKFEKQRFHLSSRGKLRQGSYLKRSIRRSENAPEECTTLPVAKYGFVLMLASFRTHAKPNGVKPLEEGV